MVAFDAVAGGLRLLRFRGGGKALLPERGLVLLARFMFGVEEASVYMGGPGADVSEAAGIRCVTQCRGPGGSNWLREWDFKVEGAVQCST